MPDCRPGHGTPIDVEKLRSLQVMGRSSKPRPGRQPHPEASELVPADRIDNLIRTEQARANRKLGIDFDDLT